MADEIAVAVPEKIVDALTEVFIIQQFKDCYNLEENHDALNKKVESMETELSHVRTRFQAEWRVLQDPVEKCITKMEDEIKKAKELSVRIEKRRSWCFDCWNLCYPKLSTECREWNTKFVSLKNELHDEFQFLSNIERSLPAAESGLVLLQPVPHGGFEGSDFKRAEIQLGTWLAEPTHCVVGVWGMGGIGKTSLLRVIHNHFQKVSRIFETVIWVTVSQNFNIGNLQNSIAKALDLKSFESLDNDSRRMTLSASLEKKKFLLILDDAWEQIDFDEVGISFGNVGKGSKVLISTRKAEVIGAMGAQEYSLKLQPLSEEEAWQLFKKKAFINGPAALDRGIEVVAREIAKECKGLPLAVNVVGAAMTLKKTEDDWGRALKLMRNTDPNFPRLHKTIDAQLYKTLRYSYNDLSDHNLQCCFLYCAAFPEDEEINAERLVEIWIAEGLLTGKETTDLMDDGHDYLDLLANRCLIQYVVPGEYVEVGIMTPHYEYVKTIKIHDVLRDMAIHIGESEEHWLFATDQHLTNFPGEKEISNCNRISLDHNDIQELAVLKCPNLVSLLLPSNYSLRHVPQPFLSSVISLRVLDLSWTDITELPISVGELRLLEFLDLSHCRKLIELPESIGNLSALQFFNLQDCWHLKGLPSTIGNLSALQFFNLQGCWELKGLPSTIRGLKKLKHLNLDGCYAMQVNSDDIGQLISLNRLVVGNNIAVRAGDLIKLTKLWVLKASQVTADSGDVVTIDTWTEMKDLRLFKSDGVNIEKIERVEMLQLTDYGGVTLPHCEFQNLKVVVLWECEKLRELPRRSFPMLTVLKLHNLEKLESLSGPSNLWKEGSMSKLQELTIWDCPLLKKLPLGMKLPNLKVLVIKRCDSIKALDIGNGDFPMLERLELAELKELESITGSSGVWNEEATSKLERVEIFRCPLLKKLPLGMRLRNLKVFNIDRCDGIKELDIGNGDFPMLEDLRLDWLKELESITGSSGVWNEEATSKLERVEIRGCSLLKKLPLGMRLPNLKVLEIGYCDSIKELDIGNGDLPMLEQLELSNLDQLESITGSSGVWNEEATLKLERVKITYCPLLKKFPLGMRLPNLKVLDIRNCYSIKELDIGNGDFLMLERLKLAWLYELESITGSSGVWNEEATSKLEMVEITRCPLLKKLPLGMRLPNLKVLEIGYCHSIKELDIGNGDLPMLERLELSNLDQLESIRGSSGVWNEEATSKLERLKIRGCPLLRRLPRAMEKLFSLNKLHWEDRDESVVLSELFGE